MLSLPLRPDKLMRGSTRPSDDGAARSRLVGVTQREGAHRGSLQIVAWLTLKRRAKSAWLALPSASALRASRF
jgi:hypothetical protein